MQGSKDIEQGNACTFYFDGSQKVASEESKALAVEKPAKKRNYEEMQSVKNKNGGSTKDGHWTDEEHELFLNLYGIHGKAWKKLSDLMKTRTNEQIRTHAQKYFQKRDELRAKGYNGSYTMDGTRHLTKSFIARMKAEGKIIERPKKVSQFIRRRKRTKRSSAKVQTEASTRKPASTVRTRSGRVIVPKVYEEMTSDSESEEEEEEEESSAEDGDGQRSSSEDKNETTSVLTVEVREDVVLDPLLDVKLEGPGFEEAIRDEGERGYMEDLIMDRMMKEDMEHHLESSSGYSSLAASHTFVAGDMDGGYGFLSNKTIEKEDAYWFEMDTQLEGVHSAFGSTIKPTDFGM